MAENKRKEKFQGLLAYFEKFTRTPSSTPKKSKVKTPKTPKSKSKLRKSKSNKNTPIKQTDKENIDVNTPQPTTVSTPDVNIQKERAVQSLAYDSDSSYQNHATKKKRRQSFSSVRVSRKAPRRMTLIGCEISPVLLNKQTSHTRPLSWTRGSSAPTPLQIKRSLCAGEILQTEENFVSRLELLKKLYIIPLQTDRILTVEEINSIFSNVELILSLNRALLTDLKELMHDWEDTKSVGEIFVKIIPFLKIYTEYVNNHDAALGIIDHLTAKNADFRNFVERTQTDKTCNGLLLRDFLIDPVQRIPRYELLLKELIKNTPEDHPDYVPLETALNQVRNVAIVLNEKHREQKSRTRVLEIKKLFGADFPDLVQPHRILVDEGSVLLLPERRQVTIFLLNDIIIFAEPTNDKKMRPFEDHNIETMWVVSQATVSDNQPTLGYSYAPDCLDPEIGEVVEQDCVFEILWPGAKFVFLCQGSEECAKWSASLTGAIQDLLQKQPRAATARSSYRLYRDPAGIWEVTAPAVAERITKEQYEAEATTYTQQAIQDLINANALAIRSISERKRRRKSGLHSMIQRLTPHKSKGTPFTSTPSRTPSVFSPPQSPYATPTHSSSSLNDTSTPSTPTTTTTTTTTTTSTTITASTEPTDIMDFNDATIAIDATDSSNATTANATNVTEDTATTNEIPPNTENNIPTTATTSSTTTPKKSSTPKYARYSVNQPLHPRNYLPEAEPSPRNSKKSILVMHDSENSPNTSTPRPRSSRKLYRSPKGTLLRNGNPSPSPRRRRRSSTGTPSLRTPKLKSALSPSTPRAKGTSPKTKTPKKVLFADSP
eukprot:Phypoly_transcript_03062.p1 GENE.Phypoly_transcript_03062~~Phypoly_transcript_03062.p1  ORF type:complete len:830 (+),score=140.31 Phypoly_transcript_03062:3-2492(+)